MFDTPSTPYTFWTPTNIPIDAFTTFGLNAKPNSDNPIGHFGTGLKYAVAIILRFGGHLQLVVNGVEYEFYTTDKDFRGKQFQQIRMRKRRRGILSWGRSEALAFTTELGKNWGLWQAFRELESNTRDENGTSMANQAIDTHGSYITVTCPGFYEVTQETNQVFLDKKGPKVFENRHMTIYEGESNFLYYRGVRVHDMHYPARYTYDFKKGHVKLSEDRSAMETWLLFHFISMAYIQEIEDPKVLYRALNKSDRVDQFHFEGHDLSFSSSYVPSNTFRDVARKLTVRGYAPPQVSGYSWSYAPISRAPVTKKLLQLGFTDDQWRKIADAMKGIDSDIYKKIDDALEDVPF
jgi:hypothetical protein